MDINCFKYSLPFLDPLQTTKNTFENRHGIIIEFINEDLHYFGEAAPLPRFSKVSLDEIQRILRDIEIELKSIFKHDKPVSELQNLYEEKEIPAELQFGIDSLAYQIEAGRSNKSLKNYLFPDAPSAVQVNGLVPLLADDYLKKTEKKIEAGFKTLKYKVGLDFETELHHLREVRKQFPELIIRVDANQQWTTEEALEKCNKLASLNLEYCEEPLRKPTPENFELLHNRTELPLAIDETISQVSYWPNLLPFMSYIILKPMLLGSFTKLFETKRLADTHENKAVFTSSLESGIGRAITAMLASGKGASEIAHGLATGNLFANDIYSDSAFITNGYYDVTMLLNQPKQIAKQLHEVSSKIF